MLQILVCSIYRKDSIKSPLESEHYLSQHPIRIKKHEVPLAWLQSPFHLFIIFKIIKKGLLCSFLGTLIKFNEPGKRTKQKILLISTLETPRQK